MIRTATASMRRTRTTAHLSPDPDRLAMRVWIVLPAYNEAANLPVVIRRFRELTEEAVRLEIRVIVVDDGSTDDTGPAAVSAAGPLPLEVIRHEPNRGLAQTFMRGMTEATARTGPGDIVVCMDADNSHIPGQIPRMVQEIQEGRDVVIASRYQRGAVIRGVPWIRRVLSRGMAILFRVIYPIQGVRDYSCGYRAYRAELLKSALAVRPDQLFAADGFACMVGMLLHLERHDAVFGEVPLVLRYDQKQGASKMKVGLTVFRTLRVLMRERLRPR
jgi:dolichol-phosphate mannosyltransferase